MTKAADKKNTKPEEKKPDASAPKSKGKKPATEATSEVTVNASDESMVDPIPPGDPEARTKLESFDFLHVSDVHLPTGKGAIGRENLPVDETLIYSLLTSMEHGTVSFPDGPKFAAFSRDQRMICSSWDTTKEKNHATTADGRQRFKAEREINRRAKMLETLVLDNKGDIAKARGAAVQRATSKDPDWKWARELALPMYFGGVLGDNKQNMQCKGIIDASGKAIEYAVYTDWTQLNPHDKIAMLGIAQRTEFSRVGTSPTVDAQQISDMCKVLPVAHVAQLRGVDERTIRNRVRILKLDPKVQEAIDLGGEKGGISWRQAEENFFTKPSKAGGELEPIPPEKQLAILPKIAGTKKRGGKPEDNDLKAKKAKVIFKGSEDFFFMFTESLEGIRVEHDEALNEGRVSEDASPLASIEAILAFALFLKGEEEALDEYPEVKALCMDALNSMGLLTKAPEAKSDAPVSAEIRMANNLQDLFTRWQETRTEKPDEFNNLIPDPRWPEAKDLAPDVAEALGDIRMAYHNKISLRDAADNALPDKLSFALDFINERYLKIKSAEAPEAKSEVKEEKPEAKSDAPVSADERQMDLPATAEPGGTVAKSPFGSGPSEVL